MSTRRVLAFTGARSDYDLMSGLYRRLHADARFEVGLIVAGSHMSSSFGSSVDLIRRDGVPIAAAIDNLIDSDRPSGRLKSAAVLLQSCVHNVEAFQPDLLLCAGDREDVIVAALAGAYMEIPVAHFFGGDHATDGNVDNPIRHATSKLATVHFVIHESHAERLQRMGEPAERIHVIGSPALDKFVAEPRLSREEVVRRLDRPDWTEYAVLIQHPILGYEEQAGVFFSQTLEALTRMNIAAFVSYPNSDAGNKQIVEIIERARGSERIMPYKNLDRTTFVNLLRHAQFMIGNSSAGLFEAPSIPLAAVNVGERQRGRYAAENVVFVEQDVDRIMEAVRLVLSPEFRARLQHVKSPYGDGRSVENAVELLATIQPADMLRKREDPLHP